MSERHPEGMRSQTLTIWKYLLSAALVVALTVAILAFRREIAETVVETAAYTVWVLNLFGQIIPQQILWFLLLILFLYITVGSFYGKKSKDETTPMKAAPVLGPVETLAHWIDGSGRGVYAKWQIANQLGKIHQTIQQNASHGTSQRLPDPPAKVQAYLEAGIHTSYADYPVGLFQLPPSTPFDIDLNQVVDYLESQMEIQHERKN